MLDGRSKAWRLAIWVTSGLTERIELMVGGYGADFFIGLRLLAKQAAPTSDKISQWPAHAERVSAWWAVQARKYGRRSRSNSHDDRYRENS